MPVGTGEGHQLDGPVGRGMGGTTGVGGQRGPQGSSVQGTRVGEKGQHGAEAGWGWGSLRQDGVQGQQRGPGWEPARGGDIGVSGRVAPPWGPTWVEEGTPPVYNPRCPPTPPLPCPLAGLPHASPFTVALAAPRPPVGFIPC